MVGILFLFSTPHHSVDWLSCAHMAAFFDPDNRLTSVFFHFNQLPILVNSSTGAPIDLIKKPNASAVISDKSRNPLEIPRTTNIPVN